MKLNLGAASTRIPGFLNVDADPQWDPDILADLTAVEFDPASIEEIYLSHTLEHLPFDDGRALLQRCAHWMIPGGILWVAVPDFDRLCEIVVRGEGDTDYVRNHFYGNTLTPWNAHRSGWTKTYMTHCLENVGIDVLGPFTSWVPNIHGDGSDASGAWFEFKDGTRCGLSLNLKARRRQLAA